MKNTDWGWIAAAVFGSGAILVAYHLAITEIIQLGISHGIPRSISPMSDEAHTTDPVLLTYSGNPSWFLEYTYDYWAFASWSIILLPLLVMCFAKVLRINAERITEKLHISLFFALFTYVVVDIALLTRIRTAETFGMHTFSEMFNLYIEGGLLLAMLAIQTGCARLSAACLAIFFLGLMVPIQFTAHHCTYVSIGLRQSILVSLALAILVAKPAPIKLSRRVLHGWMR
jgi:hypothetical protein